MAAQLRRWKAGSGFTLIEVLMAVTILSIGILAWVSSQNQNLKARTTSSHLNTAVELARSWLEEKSAEVQDWSKLHNSTSSTSSQAVEGISYSLTGDITNGGQMVPGGLTVWELAIEVDWTHFGSHTVELKKVVIGG